MDSRIKNKPEDFAEVVRSLSVDGKLTVRALCLHYNIPSANIIKRWLEEAGITIQKSNARWEDLNDIEALKTTIANATWFEEISLYNQSVTIFNKIITRNNINTTHLRHHKDLIANNIRALSKQKRGATEIAKILALEPYVVNNIAKKYNIKFAPYAGTRVINKIKDIELFKQDCIVLSLRDIQRKYGIRSQQTVADVCTEIGIPPPKKLKEKWAIQSEDLESKFNEIVKLNEKYDIAIIKQLLNIDVSLTKIYKFLSTKGYEVQLHSCNKSKGELELKDYIRELGVECKSVKYSYDGKTYELDILCTDKKLAFEYCGEYWHSLNNGINKQYHQDKFLWCQAQGIKLITIWESEWRNNRVLIQNMIKSRLGLCAKIWARQCTVSDISLQYARDFHEENHINGFVNSSINIGILHESELVGVMSFSKSRFTNNHDYEITRMSFKQGYNVIGGASKMLSYFRKHYPGSIMTYADLRFGNGSVYEKIGFQYDGVTKPNYWYFKRSNLLRFSRMHFQKKKVLKMFPEADATQSEQEIMMNNGYLVVYDCGSKRYVLNYNIK